MELEEYFDSEVGHFGSTREEHLFHTFHPLWFSCALSLVWKIITLIVILPWLVLDGVSDQQKQGL